MSHLKKRTQSLQGVETRRWWLPLRSLLRIGREKAGRHPLHGLFATANVLTASVIGGTVAHLVWEGKTKLYRETEGGCVWRFAVGLVLALAWQSVLEYYWHRLMHLPAFYARLHKYHHFYKSPEPFDDMMIHPLEAFGYYLQLYSPPFLFSMPMSSFVAYMVVCGTCGVLDHSGVAFSVPGLYDTAGDARAEAWTIILGRFFFPRNAVQQKPTPMGRRLYGRTKPTDFMLL
ncbi:unnamed protein product [Laminaria digitata]